MLRVIGLFLVVNGAVLRSDDPRAVIPESMYGNATHLSVPVDVGDGGVSRALSVPRGASRGDIEAAAARFVRTHDLDSGGLCAPGDAHCVAARLTDTLLGYQRDGAGAGPTACRNEPCGILTRALDARGSNKVPNGYGPVYDVLFRTAAARAAVAGVLEIGVGTVTRDAASSMAAFADSRDGATGARYAPGASLRAWRDAFPGARVVGLDADAAAILPAAEAVAAGVETYAADSTDGAAMSALLSDGALRGARFDLIVDDGLHTHAAQLATLRNCWRALRPGGAYVVEDIHSAWRSTMQWDRAALADIIGRDAPYFFVDRFMHQTATTAIPMPDDLALSVLVISKPDDREQ